MSSHKKAQKAQKQTQKEKVRLGNDQSSPENLFVPSVPSVPFVPLRGRFEHQLLLASARTKASPEQIRLLRETRIDWNYFFLVARRHAVVPLVYRQLKNIVPPEHLQRFKQHYQENAARNVVLSAELCRLIKLFGEEGIEAIPYKGPVLSLIAYDDLALRRFVDLDVIVKKHDVPRARDLLLADNYTLSKSFTVAQQEFLLRTQHNLQFTKDNRQLIVELHWEVAPHLFASTVQGETLWRNLVPFELNGTTVKTFSPDDLLFSLCVHGSRHLWERLGWICDVAELISRRELDWPALLDRARHADTERMFLLGLHLAEKLFQTNLPPEVKRRCEADKRLDSLAENIIEHLFNGPEHVPATSSEIFKYNLGVRKTLSARARYVVHTLRPTDGDLGDHALPARLNFAYYLIRPFRLLLKPRINKVV